MRAGSLRFRWEWRYRVLVPVDSASGSFDVEFVATSPASIIWTSRPKPSRAELVEGQVAPVATVRAHTYFEGCARDVAVSDVLVDDAGDNWEVIAIDIDASERAVDFSLIRSVFSR